MIDISKKIGLPASFDPDNLKVEFGNNVIYKKYWEKNLSSTVVSNEPLWKSLKFASNFTNEDGDIIKEPVLENFWSKNKLYFGYRGIYLNNKGFLDEISKNNITPDITILPAGRIDNEYIRTEGHEHLSLTPEVYEVIFGNAIFILFKPELNYKENINDAFAIFAEEGDHILFPPSYHHITVNMGDKPLFVTDFNSSNANSDFKFIKKHNGAPYWVIKGNNGPEFLKNPRYKGEIPQIRIVKPAEEIEEFGLRKGVPMFSLVKEGKINMLDFLNDSTNKYDPIYQKAFYSAKL